MWPQQAGSQIVFQNTICAVHRLSNQKSSMSCRNQTRSRNARRQHRTLPVSSCTVCPLASKVLHGLPCPLTLPPQPCTFHWPSPAKPDVFLLALHLKLGNRPSSNINIFFCIFDLEEKKKSQFQPQYILHNYFCRHFYISFGPNKRHFKYKLQLSWDMNKDFYQHYSSKTSNELNRYRPITDKPCYFYFHNKHFTQDGAFIKPTPTYNHPISHL